MNSASGDPRITAGGIAPAETGTPAVEAARAWGRCRAFLAGRSAAALFFATTWLIAAPATAQSPVQPHACNATAITTGGRPTAAVTGAVYGGVLQNPKQAADQGIVTAEPLYLDSVTSAGTTGNGTTLVLAPGDLYYLPANSAATVSINAASDGHKIACERW